MRHTAISKLRVIFLPIVIGIVASCSGSHYGSESEDEQQLLSGLEPELFDSILSGKPTALYTLTNDEGMEVCITNLGANIVSIVVPGRDGTMHDVAIGYDSLGDYSRHPVGGVLGRYAGEMHKRKIESKGQTVLVDADRPSWNTRVFDAEQTSESKLTLRLESTEADDKLPSRVAAQIEYTLNDDNSLTVDVTVITDSITPVDVAQRIFFNLDGVNREDSTLTTVGKHRLKISSDQYVRMDSMMRPTGELLMSIWTPYDFLKPARIARLLNGDFSQMRWAGGLHGYFLTRESTDEFESEIITLSSNVTGITLTVSTSMPCVEIYTANAWDGSVRGKHGAKLGKRTAVGITPSLLPDISGTKAWDSRDVLRKGEVYNESTTYKFTVAD